MTAKKDPVKAGAKTCFSYKRWSSAAQGEDGKSSDFRQTIGPRVAAKYGWNFDPNLSITDDGLSGYHGKNIGEKGGLGTLLRALKAGAFAKGRVMIIDEMSRLTRLGLRPAQQLLTDLLENGLELYIDRPMEKHITLADLDDPMAVTLFVWQIWANHEYSKKLSGNIATAYRKKKLECVEQGKSYRFRCFGWLKWEDAKGEYVTLDGWKKWDSANKRLLFLHEYDPNEDKIKSVKRIFDLANLGYGVRTITRTLNEEKLPCIGAVNGKKIKSTGWATVSVQRIIRGREVLGWNDNVDPPVKMFPQIINEKRYYSANAKMDARKTGKFYGRTNDAKNLFVGLAKCTCGRAMVLHYSDSEKTLKRKNEGYGKNGGVGARGGKKMLYYLQCSGFADGTCSSRQIRYDQVEASFSQSLFRPDFREQFNRSQTPQADNTTILRGQLAEVRKQLEKVQADYEMSLTNGEPSNRIASVIFKFEAKEKELLDRIEQEKTRSIGTTPVKDAYSDFLKTIHQDWTNKENRLKLRELIRVMVDRMTIDVNLKTYDLYVKGQPKPIHVECDKQGCRIDGVEYIFTSQLNARIHNYAPRKARMRVAA